jgi:multidrug resistance efflux pump
MPEITTQPEPVEISTTKQTSVSVSVNEKDIATLNNYADKKVQEISQLSEVMTTMPSMVQRGGIYFISAAVGFTSILLYFSKVPVWLDAQGNIVPEIENTLVTATESGIITAIMAKAGQRLDKDATLFEIKPTRSDSTTMVGSQQLQTWQTLQQKELDITREKIQLARLELRLKSPTKIDNANHQDIINLTEKIQDLQTEIANIKTKIENPLPSTIKNKITMPQAGIVSQLKVNKTGEFISKDTVVATIIPDADRLIVEAVVSDRDIASIKLGMKARIKIDAYNFHDFGTIPAQVSQIIPNLDNQGEFIIVLDLLKNTITHDGQEITLLPGLNVQVEINAEEKRLLELLFSK